MEHPVCYHAISLAWNALPIALTLALVATEAIQGVAPLVSLSSTVIVLQVVNIAREPII